MKLYDTLTRQLKEITVNNRPLTMYVCGLTPYSPPHLGHAMKAIVFDVLRRYIEYSGVEVIHVENITDIDDKMIKTALENKKTVTEIAEENTKVYFDQMSSLNVLRPHIIPKATEEMATIISIIKMLQDKKYAYEVEGDVYFRVRKSEYYGEISGRSLDGLKTVARVDPNPLKEDPLDFVLWKSKKPEEPFWESPWGEGRPGWHIECTAMVYRYLGSQIDIHGGGQDLIFPHHENENVQSEAMTSFRPMANHWVHNGLLRYGDDKMSKSIGNLVSVSDVISRFSSDALRLFFLTSHYRSPLTFNEEAIESQETGLSRLKNALIPSNEIAFEKILVVDKDVDLFEEAMNNDLNTPQALAILFGIVTKINHAKSLGEDVLSAQEILMKLSKVLGLTLQSDNALPAHLFSQVLDFTNQIKAKVIESGDTDSLHILSNVLADICKEELDNDIYDIYLTNLIDTIIETRNYLRSNKLYELSDFVRDGLAELNVVIEDSQDNSFWKYSR
jgi:cysteinyl-tRNA synthetase